VSCDGELLAFPAYMIPTPHCDKRTGCCFSLFSCYFRFPSPKLLSFACSAEREKRGKKKQCESASCVIKAAKIIQCASPGEPKVPRQTAQAGEKHTRRGRYRKSVERRREEKKSRTNGKKFARNRKKQGNSRVLWGGRRCRVLAVGKCEGEILAEAKV
jgi:FKBP-type peptidyl-prolyl cis-trans isomerase